MAAKRQSIRASFADTSSIATQSVSCNISFKGKLASTIDATLHGLNQVWLEAGYEEEEKQNLLGCFLEKLQQHCTQELEAETKILEHAKQQLKSDYAQYCVYCTQLGRPSPESEAEMGSNLSDMLAELERRTEIITKEVLEREAVLNAAIKDVKDLCTVLGEPMPEAKEYAGPAGTHELADIRVKLLHKLRERLAQRKTEVREEQRGLVSSCLKCAVDMSLSSLAAMQQIALSAEEQQAAGGDCALTDAALMALVTVEDEATTAPVLTQAKLESQFKTATAGDLALLRARLASLDREKQQRKASLASTGVEIARLWTLLRVPVAEREEFQKSFKMNLSRETLDAGEKELARLQDLRRQNFKAVIASIRQDICGLWMECDGIPTPEEGSGVEVDVSHHAEEFPAYFTPVEDLDDQAMELHETELSRLKAYVEQEYRPLLTKVARREAIVQDRAALAVLQQNPERLTARGPSAREDRKREEVMTVRVRGLDKLTKDLTATITQWEATHGKQFVYNGNRYLDTMVEQEEAHVSARDSQRNARKRKDSSGPTTVSKTMRKSGTAHGNRSTANTAGGSQVMPLSTKNLNLHVQESGGAPEKERLSRASTISSDTCCTSATEIKERASTCTVVRESRQL